MKKGEAWRRKIESSKGGEEGCKDRRKNRQMKSRKISGGSEVHSRGQREAEEERVRRRRNLGFLDLVLLEPDRPED